MTFHLTEDQATIQQLARDFAQSELAPIAVSYTHLLSPF